MPVRIARREVPLRVIVFEKILKALLICAIFAATAGARIARV
jgi:hypothetical protein